MCRSPSLKWGVHHQAHVQALILGALWRQLDVTPERMHVQAVIIANGVVIMG